MELIGLVGLLGAGVLLLILRHEWQLGRLIRWAREPIGAPVPDAAGRWGDAFLALHHRARAAAQQRQELNEALERFREAAQVLPDGVVLLNERLAIDWINSHAEHLLGLDNRRDRGAPIINLVREPEFVVHLRSRHFGQVVSFRSSRESGHSLQVQAIPFAQGGTLLLVRDVTQMERLETMRRDFVANISHELKTPLTVVAGFVETLEDGWQDMRPQEIRHFLALAGDQAARMRRLIDDLLTLSSLETDILPHEERVAMAPVLAEIDEETRALSAGRHEVSLEQRGPAHLLGNGGEIRSALANLASNAVRYTPAGGRIELRWLGTEDGGAAFTVTDTGIGIEPQHLPRLTERFYRVDRGRSRETGGTGLGLAIVKHVLERHGGRLAIDSQPGHGSIFSALFPPRRVCRD